MKIRTLLLTIVLGGCAGQSTNLGASDCIRHIVNHYGGTWTFTASERFGTVIMIPISKDGARGAPIGGGKRDTVATIGPTQTWEIIYRFGVLNIADGTIEIKDVNNVSNSYHYSSFFGGKCPEINHSGGTGAVALNDPADGDYSIDAYSWSAAKR